MNTPVFLLVKTLTGGFFMLLFITSLKTDFLMNDFGCYGDDDYDNEYNECSLPLLTPSGPPFLSIVHSSIAP